MVYVKNKNADYRERYLTGRKHCSRCGCWRHVYEFGVAKWFDIERTVPLKLASTCKRCDAARAREKGGYMNRRDAYKYGVPGSQQYREGVNAHRREAERKRRARMTKRERAIQAEYLRFMRNATRGSVSRRTIRSTIQTSSQPEVRLDPEPFFAWHRTRPDAYLTEVEAHAIRAIESAIKSGEQPNIRLTIVDAVMTRAGDAYLLPTLYPLDKSEAA